LNALGTKQEGRGIDDNNKMLGVVGIIDGMVMCGTDLVAMLSMVSMVLVLGVGNPTWRSAAILDFDFC